MALKASRFLSPKADIVFKRIFGDHDHLLISFLNALMPLPDGVEIKSLEYLTPEQIPIMTNWAEPLSLKCKCNGLKNLPQDFYMEPLRPMCIN
jgi:hypothetical protein